MCGWCVERFALEIIAMEQRKPFPGKVYGDSLGRYFLLRECCDFPVALKRLQRSMKRRGLIPEQELHAGIVLLRTMETLMLYGFTSAEYQHLIRQKFVRTLIANACGESAAAAFRETTAGLGVESLAILYDADTYLSADKADELWRLSLSPSCQRLLRHYRSWWLQGEGLRKNDLDKQMTETGILDPIEDIACEEHERFDLLLPAIYFSIMLLGRLPSGERVMQALAAEELAGVPGFDGKELWLQRLAALYYYDQAGFDALLGNLNRFRATLFYYIDLKRGFTAEQKRQLLELARQNPDLVKWDDNMSIVEWLEESRL